MKKPDYTFKILTTAAEMEKHYELIKQLEHGYDKKEYGRLLSEMIPNGYCQMVALDGDKCVAIAGYWINTKLFTGKYGELDNVVVDSAHRSQGIGDELCKRIEADAIEKGCKYIVLDCFLENKRAQQFYNRLGYFARGYHMIKKM
jgi:ribosomal protein S18 acetylase RimI-like enzyme